MPCAICGKSVERRSTAPACDDCWQESRVFSDDDAMCWKCGAPARKPLRVVEPLSIQCNKCGELEFTAARACGLYEGVLRASVLGLKREPHVGRRLRETMIRAQLRAPIADSDLIIPVPLHAKRETERGHNQAAVLARELARATGLEFDEHVLVRRTHTERHRAGMDARARRDSVAGAFEVRVPKHICGRRVLLIDDVFTTGATVSECAAVLKSAGAADVFVLTIARA